MKGQEFSMPDGEFVDSNWVAEELAQAALEEQGIGPENPSYHPARFVAIRAARLTLDLRAKIEPVDTILIPVIKEQ